MNPEMQKSIVVRTIDGQEIFSANPDALLNPASLQKLVVTGAALAKLGGEHRFYTELLADGPGPKIGTLYVRAGGDPDFKIEDAWRLARELGLKGVKKIGRLIVDESFADGSKEREGQRAYETGASPLAFNFNSAAFLVCPGPAVGSPAMVKTDPPEYSPEILGSIKTVGSGPGVFSINEDMSSFSEKYRVGGTMGLKRGCETFYRSVKDPLKYLGRTFLGLLKSAGIAAPESFAVGVAPSTAVSLGRHESKPLALILRDMNHFSSNFIAEELVYSLADDEPRTRGRGLEQVAHFAAELGAKDFKVDDASGLSRSNFASARMFADLIQNMTRDPALSEEFISSLSVGGRSGTLKKRDLYSSNWTFRGKTGSLNGVSSVAGLAASGSNRAIVVIIFNRVSSLAEALKLQESIIKAVGSSL